MGIDAPSQRGAPPIARLCHKIWSAKPILACKANIDVRLQCPLDFLMVGADGAHLGDHRCNFVFNAFRGVKQEPVVSPTRDNLNPERKAAFVATARD